MNKQHFFALLGLLAFTGTSTLILAQEDTRPNDGSFTTSVGINVPEFHGIEPGLSLSYSSSADNGQVGLGWSLSGLSEIERASKGKGAPKYTSSDIFLFDGQELIACTSRMVSPSCSSGGTHTTKVESYQRFKFDATNNQWTITGTEGTRYIYRALLGHDKTRALGTFRWALSSVIDTHANQVDYTYWCDGVNDCYPDKATYNGSTVKFYWETRPDSIFSANGKGQTRTNHRLKTIDVLVGEQRLNVYSLTYEQSSSDKHSMLASVTAYGTDAILDTEGAITSGTSLPSTTFDYSNEANGSFEVWSWSRKFTNNYERNYVDVNGDGIADMIQTDGSHVWVGLDDGSGAFEIWPWARKLGAYKRTYADVNGDGKADMIQTDGYRVWVGLGDGSGAFEIWSWSRKFTNNYERNYVDVNGDGKFDMIRTGNGRMLVGLADGEGGFEIWSWVKDFGAEYKKDYADVNGDGITDLILTDSLNTVRVGLADGLGGFEIWSWSRTHGNYERTYADVNGDGKADMIQTDGNRVWVGLGDGSGAFEIWSWSRKLGAYKRTYADVNGDGKADMIQTDGNRVWVGLGDGSGAFEIWSWTRSLGDYERTYADVNGDGKADMIQTDGYRVWAGFSAGKEYGKLISVTNSLGGTTSIEYTPSSKWKNTNNPPITQTVSAITVDDGRGQSERTRYRYAGGLYDRVNKEFLGFRTITSTPPCLAGESRCPYQVTTYRQDLATRGAVEKIERFIPGSGWFSSPELVRRTEIEYQTKFSNLPYTGLSHTKTSTVFENGVSKQTKTTRSYDGFGNVTSLTSHGDVNVLGDEITTINSYQPNTANYIVSLPYQSTTYFGVDGSTAKLQEVRFVYDNSGSMPIRGDVTEKQIWLDAENRFITQKASFNSRGNVTSTYDELGARTDYIYDSTYHHFLVETRSPLYTAGDLRHKSTLGWDTVCGLKTASTDENGQVTRYQYDALCRLKRVDFPNGNFRSTTFHHYGDATQQYTRVETPGPAGQANLWSHDYLDGMGRLYKTRAQGTEVGVVIQSLTEFNARGFISRESDQHRVGGIARWTTVHYDALDREVSMVLPDGRRTTIDYAIGPYFTQETTTDALGNRKVSHSDALGRNVQMDAYLNGQVVSTHYAYDILGNLRILTDDVGNEWTYQYDSLGRKTQEHDPDLGVRSYQYDDASQLVLKVDALGQRTVHRYDAVGRPLSTTSREGMVNADTVTYTYDQARDGFFNVGRLTTTGNAHQSIMRDYNEAGQVAQTTHRVDGKLYVFNTGFDHSGRTLWQRYPDGDQVGSSSAPWQYNAAGLLSSIPGIVDSIVYNDHGQATQKRLANGVITDYEFDDDNGWLRSINSQSVNSILANEPIQEISYERDDLGLLISTMSAQTNESWNYQYDDLYRLTVSTNWDDPTLSQTLTYDTIGNMRSNSRVGNYTYPTAGSARPHAVQAAGTGNYTYDDNGNMRSGNGRSITYDGLNRPVSINDSSFVYGPSNRLKKTENGVTTTYIGNLEIRGGVTTTYLPGDAKRVGGQTFWLHKDHIGSLQAVTDATGTLVQRYVYAAFGEQLSKSSEHIESRGFVGQVRDESGLMFLNARYYDPVLGRFITADPSDPLSNGVGLNRYSYAFNNPIALKDTSGLAVNKGTEYDREKAARDSAKPSKYGRAYQARRDKKDAAREAAKSSGGGSDKSGTGVKTTQKANPAQEKPGLYHVQWSETLQAWEITGVAVGVVTDYAAVNGMLNDLAYATELMGTHLRHAYGPQVNEYTLYHNPTQGGIADLWESALDKVGLTNDVTEQFSEILGEVQSQGRRVSWVAHSQGGIIFAEAARIHGGNLSMHSVAFHATGSNRWRTNQIMENANITNHGYLDHPYDPVPNFAGLNIEVDVMFPERSIGGTLFQIPNLFAGPDVSPHTLPNVNGEYVQ